MLAYKYPWAQTINPHQHVVSQPLYTLILLPPNPHTTHIHPPPHPTQTLEADLVLWAAGMGPTPKLDAVRLPFPADTRGCTQTDETLQVLGNARVFALGDIAVCASKPPQRGGGGARGAPTTTTEANGTQGTQGAGAPGPTGMATGNVTTFPATAQVAFQQADYVAWNVWASINKRAKLAFQYQHLGELLSLGMMVFVFVDMFVHAHLYI